MSYDKFKSPDFIKSRSFRSYSSPSLYIPPSSPRIDAISSISKRVETYRRNGKLSLLMRNIRISNDHNEKKKKRRYTSSSIYS